MRKTSLLLLVLMSWMLFSCTRVLESDISIIRQEEHVTEKVLTVKATIGENPGTKTAVQSDGTSIYWTPGDAINLFYGTASAGQFTTAIESPALTTDFSGTLSVATGTSTESGVTTQSFWGVYPYNVSNTCTGDGVTLTIPSTQSGVAGSFADKLNPSVATSPGLSLAFYNVGSWFIFSVTQDDIVSVTLRGHNNEDLAGRVKVTMDPVSNKPVTQVLEGQKSITMTPAGGTFEVGESYYMVVIPRRMSSGLELTLKKSNGKQATLSIASDVTFERSRYLRKLNADSGLEFDSNIHFADNYVKSICVANWDTNHDGELSYDEAAAVTSIPATTTSGPSYFYNNKNITSFDEFQYFVNCTTIEYDSEGSGDDKEYYGAFESCTSLRSITFPPSLSIIGFMAFSKCSSLEDVVIPASVTNIKGYAFMGAYKAKLHFTSSNPTAITFSKDSHDTGAFAFGSSSDFTTPSSKVRAIYVPTEDAVTACGAASEWSRYSDRIFVEGSPYPDVTITLDQTALTLKMRKTATVTPTFMPEIATDMRFTCTSNNPSVATCSLTGKRIVKDVLITAVAPGEATITLTATDGGNTATCNITVFDPGPADYNGHNYVNLGLSVMWATMNVGATSEEEYGHYYAWGETEPYTVDGSSWESGKESGYIWSSYKLCNGRSSSLTKYNFDELYGTVDEKGELDLVDDAANDNWGGTWRMPTSEEWEELMNNCTWARVTVNGNRGYRGTSKIVGFTYKTVFIPEAGYRSSRNLYNAGSSIYYWSSTINRWNSQRSYGITSGYGGLSISSSYDRVYGLTIRPVSDY